MDFSVTKKESIDLKNSINVTQKDLIAALLEYLGVKSNLTSLYEFINGYKKTKRKC